MENMEFLKAMLAKMNANMEPYKGTARDKLALRREQW
jgi:hypothetical protein